jgi:anti-anti-sigma factor
MTHQLIDFDSVGGVVVATVVCNALFAERGIDVGEVLLGRAADGDLRFVLDLQNVESIDSMFLGVLVEIHNRLAKLGGCIVLANAGRHVHSVFRVTKLETLIPIRSSVLSAVSVASGEAVAADADEMPYWLGGR